MANISKRKSGSSYGSGVSRRSQGNEIVRIQAAGVPVPAPAKHQGAVKGATLGGAIGAATLAFTPFGPAGILFGGIVGLTIGVCAGAAEDEKRMRDRW